MEMNFREMLEMSTLTSVVGQLNKLDAKQKKACKNIKYCANDQWSSVNSVIDHDDDDGIYRAYVLNADELFSEIYESSLKNRYSEGCCQFGASVESFMKDVRFCGKEFLEKVTLYYVAKFLEESAPEVEATEEEVNKIIADLTKIKNRVYGIKEEPVTETLVHLWSRICKHEILLTKKNEEWIELTNDEAEAVWNSFMIDECLLNKKIGRTKMTVTSPEDGRTYQVNKGKNPYLWDMAAC